jgi:hypothetical protein
MVDVPQADRSERPVIVDLRGSSAVVQRQAGPYALTCSFAGIDRTDHDRLRNIAANAGSHDEPIEPVGDSVFTAESLSSTASTATR